MTSYRIKARSSKVVVVEIKRVSSGKAENEKTAISTRHRCRCCLGLAVVELDQAGNPVRPLAGFVRTFPVPEGAANRRRVRSMRRKTARRRRRLQRLKSILEDAGMYGTPRTASSPIKLRAKATREIVTLQELSEAILHIAKHRGKATRRSMKAEDDNEKGLVNRAVSTLKSELNKYGFDTYGQYLRMREKKGLATRINPRGSGKDTHYAFYPTRGMLEGEFDIIWNKQQEAHQGEEPRILTDSLRDTLKNEIFFQRDFTPPPPGKCPFVDGELRLRKSSRLFQIRRILEDANHIRFYDNRGRQTPYTVSMRDRIVEVLMSGEDLTPAEAKRVVGLGRTDKVNFEDGPVPKRFKGYPIDRAFDEAGVGPTWRALTAGEQDKVLESLETTQSDEHLKTTLVRHFPDSAIESVIDIDLPRGYGNAGETATKRLIEALKSEVVPGRVAQDRAGLVHAMTVEAEPRARLPYYGEILTNYTVPPMWVSVYRRESDRPPSTDPVEERFGRIANPVVHVALNQIRKTVNEVIAKFGCPASIHVELSRSLRKSPEERDRIARMQAARKEENDVVTKKLRAISVTVSGSNIRRYRLWKEQDGICVYSGESISLSRLFGGDIDVDHVIPKSFVQHGVSLKAIDAMSNRVVCLRSANAAKGSGTPYEAFGTGEETGYDWAAIQRRASTLSDAKQKRFNADTRERFTEEDSFRGRDGTDNAYIARITRQYLACLYGNETPVIAVTGHLVDLLRRKWGVR
ncbi:MAG: hypothetical protein OXQ29_15645 [Rhodospirillaceae bacterium]|nr:hypothetical protein [Rhodospirillaceae bacterium]